MATGNIPLQGNLDGRFSEDKDFKIINGYVEQDTRGNAVTVKRPGTSLGQDTGGTNPRGITTFRDSRIVVVDDQILDQDGNSLGTINTTSGQVYFGNLFSTNLFISDQENGYVLEWDGSNYSLSEVTDSNFVTPHKPGVSVQGGYIFILDKNGTIYNSNFDDPFTWDQEGFITAENYPDAGQRITTFENYVVVLGTQSLEVFYNAAVEPPSSPLKVNEQAFNNIGTFAPHSAVTVPSSLIWVGVDIHGGFAVYRMNGFNPERISNRRIERLLETEWFDITDAYAFAVFVRGHSFYVLQLKSQSKSLVFDMQTGLWAEWETGGGQFFGFDSEFFPGENYILGQDSHVYSMDEGLVDDYNSPINMLVRTDRLDFDIQRDKFMNRLSVHADIIESGSEVPGTIRWSDDDYQTWSNRRNLDFSKHNVIHRLGKFKKRAFEIESDASVKHRWYTLDSRIQQGGYTGGTT